MKFKHLFYQCVTLVFEYETNKIVSINSIKISIIYRLIQLIIIAYIIGFVIVYQKGYQEFENGVSELISKVKGVSFTNRSGILDIWDVADYVVPPQENNAFFITTNAFITRNQTQSKCPEDKSVPGSRCSKDEDCVPFEPIILGDGIKTGKCDNTTNTCEIYAWCPVENEEQDKHNSKSPLLKNVADFTVLIKNNVIFSKFNVQRSNIPPEYDSSKLKSCHFHPINDKLCPIFIIGTILNMSNTLYQDIAVTGGIISFDIAWDCNFDFNPNRCYPTYSFRRLDPKDSTISKGWNFRYANFYYINGVQYRDLIKAYGIRFIISVSTKAGKFSVVPLTIKIGSGVALLVIATIVCDLLAIYCLKMKKKYKEAKYDKVFADDAYKPLNSDSDISVH